MKIWKVGAVVISLLGCGAALPACGAAAVAGAGAVGGIYFTSRGAKAMVNGSVNDLVPAAEGAMAQLEVPITDQSSEKGGDHREFKGTRGDLDITVTLERKGDRSTDVEVTARRNLVSWDKNFARDLLSRIVERAPGTGKG